jgi:hypothetical protein
VIQMDDFLTALMASAAKGHAMADRAAGEIAVIYKETDILKSFPVPKFSVSAIDMDMSLAVLGYKEIPQLKAEHLRLFEKDLINHLEKNLPSWDITDTYLNELNVSKELFSRLPWINRLKDNIKRVFKDITAHNIFDKDKRQSFAAFVTYVISDSFDKAIRMKLSIPKQPLTSDIEENTLKRFQNSLQDSIERFTLEWTNEFLNKNPHLPKDRSPLLAVEPKEIMEIPTDKLIKAKIHLEVRPYEWTSMEVEDEKKQKVIKYKLVPE